MNMRRDKFKPSSKAVLCSDHFEEFCFDRTGQTIRLRTDAVPTVFTFPGKMKKDRKSRNSAIVFEYPEEQPPFSLPFQEPSMQQPNKKCVTADHDYCITDSPRTLKKRLDEALGSLQSMKRRLKITQQKFRRLKFKVQALELAEDPV
ncbi:THAP domain-containing protein 1 isoform X2 [Xenopus laevis]|nr:THAP domain-containing protein 1 isoform X2 [Xenopus laevis]